MWCKDFIVFFYSEDTVVPQSTKAVSNVTGAACQGALLEEAPSPKIQRSDKTRMDAEKPHIQTKPNIPAKPKLSPKPVVTSHRPEAPPKPKIGLASGGKKVTPASQKAVLPMETTAGKVNFSEDKDDSDIIWSFQGTPPDSETRLSEEDAAVAEQETSKSGTSDTEKVMSPGDILKYIQENTRSEEETLDLFGS